MRDFVKMNLPKFLGSQLGKDPKNIIDEVKKIFVVIDTHSVKLAS